MKESPSFYIFDDKGKNLLGVAFKHSKGKGFNIVLGKVRYLAFPHKKKKSETDSV